MLGQVLGQLRAHPSACRHPANAYFCPRYRGFGVVVWAVGCGLWAGFGIGTSTRRDAGDSAHGMAIENGIIVCLAAVILMCVRRLLTLTNILIKLSLGTYINRTELLSDR